MTPERYCRQKAARSGSSFYLAFRFLPARKRRAMNALYAFCREADDAVDDAGAEKDAARRLAFWRGEIARVYAGKPRHPVGFALLRAREEFSLEREHFFALLEGMEMDLRGTRYPDFAALSLYCYRAAGVVGLLSARIFSRESGKDTAEYARNLGIAFQLTNILRDVREDARRGRIYLPREELRQYGVTEEDLLRGRDSEAFRALMRAQCRRARDFYARALGVFASLSAEERKNQRPGLMMAAVYRALLEEMECADFAVLRRRVTLSAGRKLWRMGRVFFTGRL
ncbi:MAG: presqualene diphosphate synthase HpnD [Zoogloeaceae bacterium]|nr:presqualene diphosphate synthase HpnD [Zoogloeaceae bacterium]